MTMLLWNQELVPPLATTKVGNCRVQSPSWQVETVRLPEEVLGAGFEVVRVTVEGAWGPASS